MNLHELFVKPVDRPIEGVIKADDLTSLQLEVEEYVITNEIAKRLEQFFNAYNDYVNANGVWISGFFGSGKSHLLKMLALLLENQAVGGNPAIEYFTPKCQGAILKAEMKRAASIPSKSILFNIDQKADTISKEEMDAVLAVFVKVFDEMQGYYGKLGHVAQFERDLDERGLYQDFKQAYAAQSGIAWSKGREQSVFEKINIAEAYAQVSGSTAENHQNIIDSYRADYKLSIEDFAEQVDDYIQLQEPGFRLNFFVDEVGQYIADNIKLMTNLQTIAESLATKCKGQAWIIVTAQEDMHRVLGDLGQQQSNDFSKIQDRFKTRMKLTSQNVDEVIQKRLLKKTSQGEALAGTLYNKQKNNFGTLFDFSDGATSYRNFRDEKHFINSYPFIPYQFSLFQTSIETLSEHSAFEGKHSSVGERSMLGVFQEVAKSIADRETGELATYDLMFNGIRTALKAQIQRSILLAENELDDLFAIRVLKALFLVKYVKGFNATSRNLRVLMLNNFTRDLPALRKKIEAALSLLEQQTYIQRNGETYEYLTDDEKDIEQEIKNTQADSGDINKNLQQILFDGIIKERKIRYGETGQDFIYTRKVDDYSFSREQELAIHFITSFNENVENIKILQGHSLGRDELMIVLSADARLRQDLVLYEQTDKYVRIHRASAQKDSVAMILESKGFQNRERDRLIKEHVRGLVAKARFFVSGTEIEVSGEHPQSKIIQGFNQLVTVTYPNLRMLRNISYREGDIKEHLDFSKTAAFDSALIESEKEVLDFILGNKNNGTRTTMKTVEERFSQKPYGWYLAAIQCIVAILAGRGKIEVRDDSNLLEGPDLERAIRNTHSFSNLIIDPQPEYTASQIRRLKDFYGSFFDRPPSGNEARTLGTETKDAFAETFANLRELKAQESQYPFLSSLATAIERISELQGKHYVYYLEELPQQEDDLLDMKENTINPIQSFMSGANKSIYDEASRFLQDQRANFTAISDGKPAELGAILSSPNCYKGNQMKAAKSLMVDLKKGIDEQLRSERDQAIQKVSYLQKRTQSMGEYAELSDGQRQEIEASFGTIEGQLKHQNLIAVIRDQVGRYETGEYNRLLTKISKWTQDDEEEAIEYISQRQLDLNFDKSYIADEADVTAYLDALKEALLRAIRENKRIRY